ncbi:unnamed protein product [Haemonchus placei]|uniref:FF domain-containing protein n=1 Tax=Haemonchus placei TaxID=6290 RepID=A0A0N4WWU3_HAEPC|nr:unnamed protein product [Haemonchus placei]
MHEDLGRLLEGGRFKGKKGLQENLRRFLERERPNAHPQPDHSNDFFNGLRELVNLDRGIGRSFEHSKDKKDLARMRELLRRYFDREFEKLRSSKAHHRREDFDDGSEIANIREDLRSLLKGGRAKDRKEVARIRGNLGRFLEREHPNAYPGTDEEARVQTFVENFRRLLQRQRSKRLSDREEFSKEQENLHPGLPKKGMAASASSETNISTASGVTTVMATIAGKLYTATFSKENNNIFTAFFLWKNKGKP